VRSSADHYTPPIVHATSSRIPSFFDVVVKKPVTDLATSIEVFCLSGVDGKSTRPRLNSTNTHRSFYLGVIGKLVKNESQLKGEVASLINEKLRTFIPFSHPVVH